MPGSPVRAATNTAAQTPNNNLDSIVDAGSAEAASAAAEPSESEGEGEKQDDCFGQAAIAVKVRRS